MAKIRRYKHINEDNPAPAAPANGQQPAAPANGAQQGAAPANGQQGAPANGQQQGADPNAVNLTTAVTNANTFVGNLYVTIQKTLKEQFEKACPEIINLAKDQNTPLKDVVKKLNDAYGAFTKAQIKPDDAKAVGEAVQQFTTLVSALTEFATAAGEEASKQGGDQQQQGNAQPNQAGAQPAPANGQPAAPANGQQQQNVNASYDYDGFGKSLYEKLRMAQYEKAMWRNL